MGIRLVKNESVTQNAAVEMPEEVCLLHFQGVQSKKLIMPFEAFLEEDAGGDPQKAFVLP